MYGFDARLVIRPESPRKHSTRIETFKEGVGKCTSEIYTEEMEYLCRFDNGKNHVLTARYTEFRHDLKNPEDKTVIDWHWVNFPPYGDDIDFEPYPLH